MGITNVFTTPLLERAWHGDLVNTKRMIALGKNCESWDDHGHTALIVAASRGYMDCVTYLLDEQKANIEGRNKFGQTPLIAACREFQADTVRELLKRGADINATSVTGNTALIGLCLRCTATTNTSWARTMEVLFEYSVDPEVLNENGKSAIDLADSDQARTMIQTYRESSVQQRYLLK